MGGGVVWGSFPGQEQASPPRKITRARRWLTQRGVGGSDPPPPSPPFPAPPSQNLPPPSPNLSPRRRRRKGIPIFRALQEFRVSRPRNSGFRAPGFWVSRPGRNSGFRTRIPGFADEILPGLAPRIPGFKWISWVRFSTFAMLL